MPTLLSVRDLSVTFHASKEHKFTAVDGVSFDVDAGQIVGLVGESGCGKSVTSLAIMGLLPERGNTITGEARYDGTDLIALPDRKLRDLRGSELGMIFQDPLSSLNPVVPLGLQVAEVLMRHQHLSRSKAMPRAEEMLERVGIPDPHRRLREYPHQISGGMRQRALIAMALASAPRLLIADEPTTALDVTIQAQVLALLTELVHETGTALIMITHDLGVVAGMCDEVNVLYGGKIVERSPRYPLFDYPRHPYTGGLLASIPRLDSERGSRLNPVPGSVMDNISWEYGCAFAPRCTSAIGTCFEVPPDLVPDDGAGSPVPVAPGRFLRCHNPLTPAGPRPVTPDDPGDDPGDGTGASESPDLSAEAADG